MICHHLFPASRRVCCCAGQGARSVVWFFQMNDEQRRPAQQQARPFGLPPESWPCCVAVLGKETTLPTDCALPGQLSGGNATQEISDDRSLIAMRRTLTQRIWFKR